MRDLYRNMIVDLTDPKCEFVAEFNKEINKYGAIVFNNDSNSYQFIRRFDHIDYKKEILPDLLKVETTDSLLDALQLTIHYEFDPENEDEDEENLEIWNEEISKIELPVFQYDEEGEIELAHYNPIDCKPSKHIVWFLKKESFDFIMDTDLLLLTPVIKDLNIAKELIKKYGCHPFKFKFDPADEGYEVPELYGVYEQIEDMMDLQADSIHYGYVDENIKMADEAEPAGCDESKCCCCDESCCCCGDDCCNCDDCQQDEDEETSED